MRPPPAAQALTLGRSDVERLLDRHGLAPSRALGQNFLCEPGVVDRIVRLAGVAPGDHVVEIGPGVGSLTVGLVDTGATVVAVELDRHLLPALAEVVGDRVTVIHGDATTLDWASALAPFGDVDWKVVANLPYNVATPLVLDLLAAEPRFVTWLVMMQREVGERLAAEPGSRTTGIPSILTAYWAEATVVARIPPQVFLPRPRVDSVLVRIDRRPAPAVPADFDAFQRVVRAGFGQRRKMLRRSLSSLLAEEEIVAADVDPTERAERLDLAAWGRLAEAVGADR